MKVHQTIPRVLVKPNARWLCNKHHSRCYRSTFVYGPATPTPEGVWASRQATCTGNSHDETCVYGKLTFGILVLI